MNCLNKDGLTCKCACACLKCVCVWGNMNVLNVRALVYNNKCICVGVVHKFLLKCIDGAYR